MFWPVSLGQWPDTGRPMGQNVVPARSQLRFWNRLLRRHPPPGNTRDARVDLTREPVTTKPLAGSRHRS